MARRSAPSQQARRCGRAGLGCQSSNNCCGQPEFPTNRVNRRTAKTRHPKPTMPTFAPFDFTSAMRLLCQDIAMRCPTFHHVRMEQIAVTFAQARRSVQHGLQAKLTPMRFEHGELVTNRRGRQWTIQRLFRGDVEMLYILTFYLPRFLEHSFREKMITVMHELYHISPVFDGDIRRLPGHYHVHSHSQCEYDQQMAVIVDEYMAQRPDPDVFGFLQYNFAELRRRHGGVVGVQVNIPKLIPTLKTA